MSETDRLYANSLKLLLDEAEKANSRESAMTQPQQYKILDRLLKRTAQYMAEKAKENMDADGIHTATAFSSMSDVVLRLMNGDEIYKKGEDALRIALFIHALTLEGLSINAAIVATRKWLGIGQSTVRTAFYNHRMLETFTFGLEKDHFYKLHSGQILEFILSKTGRNFLTIITNAQKNEEEIRAYKALIKTLKKPPKISWGGKPTPLTGNKN